MAGVGVERIARDFYRFGWLGVGVQAILAFIPLLMFAWALFGSALGSRPTLTASDHLALFGLTQTESHAAWVSAIDVVSLLADVSTLAGELLILGGTLWLLFRITQSAAEYDQAPPIAPG